MVIGKRSLILFALTALGVFQNCSGGFQGAALDTTQASLALTARAVVSAGPDLTITQPVASVTFEAIVSEGDSPVSSMQWLQISGPSNANLAGAGTLNLTASALVAGTYTFRLTVIASDKTLAFDDVSVTVNAAGNILPVVSAGADDSIRLPVAAIGLKGTASDADGQIASVHWKQVSGPSPSTISPGDALSASAQGLVQGTYVFQLTAKDNSGGAATDTVSVSVLAATTNLPPTVKVSSDRVIQLPVASTTLSAAASDPDGSVVSLQWTQVSGPATASISAAQSSSININGLKVGDYVFKITAKDNVNATASAQASVRVLAALTYVSPAGSLRRLGDAAGISMGTAVRVGTLSTDAVYRRTIHEHYSLLTPGNDMKAESLQPQMGVFNFKAGDHLVEFAMAHGAKVYGHTLVWHRQNPAWLTGGSFTKAQKLEILKTHVSTVAKHYADKYPGTVIAWDVVNEAVNPDGSLRNSLWSDIGSSADQYIVEAFKAARAAAPTAALYYNDYGNEAAGVQSDAVYNLIKRLKAGGMPIDGVGMQAHLSADYGVASVASIRSNIQRYKALGLKVRITEFDVRTNMSDGESAIERTRQEQGYANILEACLLERDTCTGVTTWGFATHHSWIQSNFPGFTPSLPFNDNFQTTKFFKIFSDLLTAHKK